MKVYLLRHGETEGNVKGLYAGFTDTKLTEKGINQAKNAHQFLRGESFDVVVSSSLSRAVDTAKLVTELPLHLEDGFKEMNFGSCENLTYEEICKKDPELVKAWQEDTKYFTFPEGESLRSFYDRVIAVYKQMLDQYKDKDILIVAHSGVIRSILAHEISEDFNHYWKYRVDNCKTAIIEYSSGYITLNGMNL